MSNQPLRGKTAVVTGGARGIGRGIVLELAKAGADVLIADLLEDAMQATAAEVARLDRRVALRKIDVTDAQQVQALVDQAVRDFGQLDILVNCAGVISIKPVAELSERDWDFVMDVNAKGTFLGCQAALKHMVPRGSGRIINVASIAGKEGFPNLAHYSASKFAVVGFTNALAKEVARNGITVNAICPGFFETKMASGLIEILGKEKMEAAAPLGRLGDDEDLKGLTLLYASDAGKHITGQWLAVDGGVSVVLGAA